MSDSSDVKVAELQQNVLDLQKKLDEMKLYAVKHIQNFKAQVKTLTDELAGARSRGAEAIVTTNVSVCLVVIRLRAETLKDEFYLSLFSPFSSSVHTDNLY